MRVEAPSVLVCSDRGADGAVWAGGCSLEGWLRQSGLRGAHTTMRAVAGKRPDAGADKVGGGSRGSDDGDFSGSVRKRLPAAREAGPVRGRGDGGAGGGGNAGAKGH